jgi:hypothetical protein
MKIELNYKEYTYALHSKSPKCDACVWKTLSMWYCIKFCRMGRIFRRTRVASSIFNL